jgi:parallel beta-helix repeat protein
MLPSTYWVTNTGDSDQPGSGSLRRAILDANANPGQDVIKFNIPSFKLQLFPPEIQPTSPLPQITDAVTIDGTSEPGWGTVQVDGSKAGAGASGLMLMADNCHIKGLVFTSWAGSGLYLKSSNNEIDHNLLGLDGEGNAAGNHDGLTIDGGSENIVHDNVMSGNGFNGVVLNDALDNTLKKNMIGAGADGISLVQNGACGVFVKGNTQANQILDNTISGNYLHGVWFFGVGASENLLQGNEIGPDFQGVGEIGNNFEGVEISFGASDNQIVDNTISGNSIAGIEISDSDNTVVAENTIGMNSAGDTRLPNFGDGVDIEGSSHTKVVQNLISGNTGHGVLIVGDYNNGATDDGVWGNTIGPDAKMKTAVGNGGSGVLLGPGSFANIIGANTLSGNMVAGLTLFQTTGNLVGANVIGMAPDLTTKLPNGDGVIIAGGASENLLAENFINANTNRGVFIHDEGTTNNTLSFNAIELNGAEGVLIAGKASGNVIGGVGKASDPDTALFSGNYIYGNGGAGVAVGQTLADQAAGNAVLGNRIFANAGPGIDLGDDGPTPNSPQNPGQGANQLQNYPVLSLANFAQGGITVAGKLHSAANTTYRLEVFYNPGGGNQAFQLLGSVNVTTDGNGDAVFSQFFSYAGTFFSGTTVTATATNLTTHDTSELSAPRVVVYARHGWPGWPQGGSGRVAPFPGFAALFPPGWFVHAAEILEHLGDFSPDGKTAGRQKELRPEFLFWAEFAEQASQEHHHSVPRMPGTRTTIPFPFDLGNVFESRTQL